jgi:hypothetical protein
LVPSISQNPHRLSAAILLYFQSLQNGVLRAFLESAFLENEGSKNLATEEAV